MSAHLLTLNNFTRILGFSFQKRNHLQCLPGIKLFACIPGNCEVLSSNHYHVLFDVTHVSTETLKRNKLYAVPCLYTTFKTFFSNGATKETTGEIFEKLKLAVEYNGSAPPTKGEAAAI